MEINCYSPKLHIYHLAHTWNMCFIRWWNCKDSWVFLTRPPGVDLEWTNCFNCHCAAEIINKDFDARSRYLGWRVHAQRGGRKGTELRNFAQFGWISDALSPSYLVALHINHRCMDKRQDILIVLFCCHVFLTGTLVWGTTPRHYVSPLAWPVRNVWQTIILCPDYPPTQNALNPVWGLCAVPYRWCEP